MLFGSGSPNEAGFNKVMHALQVLVANTPMDTDKIKMYGARVKTDSMTKVAEIEAAERTKMKTKCEQIIAQDINVFINRQLIYNYPEEIFTDAGVMSIEHAGALSQLYKHRWFLFFVLLFFLRRSSPGLPRSIERVKHNSAASRTFHTLFMFIYIFCICEGPVFHKRCLIDSVPHFCLERQTFSQGQKHLCIGS